MNRSNGNLYLKHRSKIVFIMGATGTGKSKLSVDLATRFHGEIINSDKIQVHKGLDIITNKISEAERCGVPHHLLGFLDPDNDFTAQDFCKQALLAITQIQENGHVPIIVGGSNSFIETLVEDPSLRFKKKFDCLFLWLDVSLPVLYKRLAKRVDDMVKAGMVDELRDMFVPGADYGKGIRRAIGAPEMEQYLQAEKENVNETQKMIMLLNSAIEDMKRNTCKLVDSQLQKINRLQTELRWEMHKIDVTTVFEEGWNGGEDAWGKVVLKPSLDIVGGFLNGGGLNGF